ncbi:MAG: HD domain-containing protein [Magnetococcales bacterium]|nr:HD domain-containing protein [Magnetococcales bacterium]
MIKKIVRGRGGTAAATGCQLQPWRVLVVDDDPDMLVLTRFSLSDFHFDDRGLEIVTAESAAAARELLAAGGSFALAIIDVVMENPEAGLQLVEHIRQQLQDHTIRLVIRTGQPGLAPERQVIDQYDIDDYKEKTELTAWKLYTTVRTALKSYRDLKLIEESRDLLKAARRHAIDMLAVASEYKDQETGDHVQRIAHYVRAIASELKLSEAVCDAMAEASVLHDLGKVSIPDAILQKPARLTAEEFEVMRTHAAMGARILGNAPGFEMAREIALYHHERWDGSGYPAGLAGTAIPVHARIVSVADVFDALVCQRPYKQAWPLERALEEVGQLSGRHFDPEVVVAFLALHGSGRLQEIQNHCRGPGSVTLPGGVQGQSLYALT